MAMNGGMSIPTYRYADAQGSGTEREVDRILRWPTLYWVGGLILLLGLELLCGTSVPYALLVCAFFTLTYFTVRTLGGPMTVMGFCVLYLAMQHMIVYHIAKILYWQPADEALVQPLVTTGVYVVGMASMLAAALLFRLIWPRWWKPIFTQELDLRRLFWLAIITTIMSVGRSILSAKGSGVVAINSAVILLPISVASSTAYIILSTQGRRSFSVMNAIPILAAAASGAVGAGRSSMVMAPIIYYVTCFAFRFRFRIIHLLVLVTAFCIAQFILFPYATYARAYVRTDNFDKNVALSIDLLEDIVLNPGKYQYVLQRDSRVHSSIKRYRFYREHTSTLDRFSVVLSADGIINATLTDGTTEMKDITPGFEALVPKYLFPYRQNIGVSNALAHRAPGLVGRTDFVTQITLGFICDSFSSYGWVGIAVIPFLLLLGFQTSYRILCDSSSQRNVYALALAVTAAGPFSEAVIATQINNIIQGFVILTILLYAIRALVNMTQNFRIGIRRSDMPLEAAEVRGYIAPEREHVA